MPAPVAPASASTDRTIELSTMDIAEAAGRVCAATTLTAAQWRHYVPELPFSAPCP